jgi:hypothetical protein
MHLRRWRRVVAPLVLVFVAITPLLATRPLPMWTAEFHNATCVGPCCVVDDSFIELSCGEYAPPLRAGVLSGTHR